MGVKIRGMDSVKRRLDAFAGETQGRKAGRAIKSAMFTIASDAGTMTPVSKTSTLINSQYQDMHFNGTRVTGRIGYSANYAVNVHNAPGKLRGRPRANGNGNYWDPAGEPKFLEKSAKDNARKVAEIIRKELSV